MITSRTYNEDINKMRWLKEEYFKYNIADKMTYKITELVRSIEFEKNDEINKEKILNLGKAIRQDFKKMILTSKRIYDYSKKNNSNKPLFYINKSGEAEIYYDEEKDITGMSMEYFLSKYRVIIEYTINILDTLIKFDKNAYKREHIEQSNNNGRFMLKNSEIQEIKLDYLKSLISEDARYSVLNIEWFDDLRTIRNEIIHKGASCMIFDEKDILFQIYDLNVEEIVCTQRYLSNGSAIYCDYFIATNIAYLVYFIDTIFSILIETKGEFNEIKNFCCKKYKTKINDNSTKITEYLKKRGFTFENSSEAQNKLSCIIDKYLNYGLY